jgi:hypothetical protein
MACGRREQAQRAGAGGGTCDGVRAQRAGGGGSGTKLNAGEEFGPDFTAKAFFCLPRAPDLALGKVFFAFSLPRAPDLALGKVFFCIFFAESPRSSSRQRFFCIFFAESLQSGSRQRFFHFFCTFLKNFFAEGYF